MSKETIDLDYEASWPSEVLSHLERHHKLFLAWETGTYKIDGCRIHFPDYDKAIHGLRSALSKYLLHGYHCTKLVSSEREIIKRDGMHLPNKEMLSQRIKSILRAGLIQPKVAQLLLEKNQADDTNRRGVICVCFFPPERDGQCGIERFFRSWGGEALYNFHEKDTLTGPILKSIGTPCLVEMDVPISNLDIHSGLETKLIRQFLVNRGLQTVESTDHSDRSTSPILPENIRRITPFPDPDFIRLTGCDTWLPTLT